MFSSRICSERIFRLADEIRANSPPPNLASPLALAHSAVMTSAIEQVETLVSPLLRTLDALGVISRHMHPVGYAHLLARAAPPHEDLRAARAMSPWPDPYSALRPLLA